MAAGGEQSPKGIVGTPTIVWSSLVFDMRQCRNKYCRPSTYVDMEQE